MNKQRSNPQRTKKSLLISLLVLFLCVAIMIGSTMAWFTDSVTSGQNIINAGNLDIGLKYSKDGVNWTDVAGESNLFTDVNGEPMLWEPGAASVAYLEISNPGALALEYDLAVQADTETEPSAVNMDGEEFKLSDYLQFAVISLDENLEVAEPLSVTAANAERGRMVSGAANQAVPLTAHFSAGNAPAASPLAGNARSLSSRLQLALLGARHGFQTREELVAAVEAAKTGTPLNTEYSGSDTMVAGADNQYVAIVVWMPDAVGNEANYKAAEDGAAVTIPEIKLTISITAYQAPGETDGFDGDYDEPAHEEEDDNFLTFSSDGEFTLSTLSCYADGLESSTDKNTWTAFKEDSGTQPSVDAVRKGDKYYVYLRGSDMTTLVDLGSYNFTILKISPEESGTLVDCSGNIMTLLDYNKPDDVTMAYYAFAFLFSECDCLRTAPSLPATNLSDGCYFYLFSGCSALESAPKLPATELSLSCYNCMFSGCISLQAAPALPATALADYCYDCMFSGCTSLQAAPALPANTLADYCYDSMFYGCSSLTTAPELPATVLAESCYSNMFSCCSSLKTAPALAATNLADYCYDYMFIGCTGLTAAPALPATTLCDCCYDFMFSGCTSLTAAPALPATTLAYRCYYYMFNGCSSLKTAPELPATTAKKSCYEAMFKGCTSLTDAPTLPATALAANCYEEMFSGCTALTAAPELNATKLPSYCYKKMFYGCTALTAATTLGAWSSYYSDGCCQSMFEGCSSLKVATNIYGTKIFSCPTNIGNYKVTDMFKGTGGTFTGTPSASTVYYWYTE